LTFVFPTADKFGLLPYTPTSGILEAGVVPETPGRLLITFAAINLKEGMKF